MPFTPQPDNLAAILAAYDQRIRTLESRPTGLGFSEQFVNLAENCSSTTDTDLATVGPSVTVTPLWNKAVLLFGSAYIQTPAGSTGYAGLYIDGTYIEDLLGLGSNVADDKANVASIRVYTGLPMNVPVTFELKYRTTSATVNFGARALAALPL